ncbi:acyl-coa n-acyltransferase [Lucifera butyrica]|uniref:Acyl-coa n-acyltransferase n=1 Tax=Lucifera butyrica TaxID=1351585 RepID=A0A498RDZ0_9FIRM|nr:GNAT family N-acetyltransferase [Lucifera butyrica]VBB08342.1 acyl-coa n-acyltransferase [Lucifera butyrica]
MDDTIVIRLLTGLADLQAMQELEQAVWHMENPVPLHQTLTAVKNGGIALGAFQGKQMVGMLYSFPGYSAKEVYVCSHMLGVRPGWRHCGLGERLKRAQAEEALRRGYALITWTYDPLETANAHLNIAKLGAVCSTYIVNCYGPMNDLLNQGLPSDRLQVAWWPGLSQLSLPRGDAARLLEWRLQTEGRAEPVNTFPIPAGVAVLCIAVPQDFQAMKQKDIELAKAWRQATRELFRQSFQSGWVVVDFQRSDGPVHEYRLVRRETLALSLEPWKRGETS